MKRYLVLNGPNLNMTGIRERGVYGTGTLEDIYGEIRALAEELGVEVDFYQSNYEGALIDQLHAAHEGYDGVILNAGAYTHYSYAIRDAISAVRIPTVEVHMSNIQNREEFRKKSVLADVCVGQISGFGKYSYFLALDGLSKML